MTPDAIGQRPEKPWRIGWLSLFPEADPLSQLAVRELKRHLSELGYLEGRDLLFEWRFADRVAERLPALARDLVALKPALIVVHSSYAVGPAREATSTIPIVMLGVPNPLESGFVASLGRPGGNVTGTSYNPPEVAGKMVEIIKAAVPRISRMTIVWNPDAPGLQVFKPHADRTAQALNIAIRYVDVRRPEEFSIDSVLSDRPDALYVVNDVVFLNQMSTIIAQALERKLPTIGVPRRFVEAGGLLYFGLDLPELFRISATYVDRILKGANPGELPIQQPTKYELVINLKTAKAIGITIPQQMLIRADEIIE